MNKKIKMNDIYTYIHIYIYIYIYIYTYIYIHVYIYSKSIQIKRWIESYIQTVRDREWKTKRVRKIQYRGNKTINEQTNK